MRPGALICVVSIPASSSAMVKSSIGFAIGTSTRTCIPALASPARIAWVKMEFMVPITTIENTISANIAIVIPARPALARG